MSDDPLIPIRRSVLVEYTEDMQRAAAVLLNLMFGDPRPGKALADAEQLGRCLLQLAADLQFTVAHHADDPPQSRRQRAVAPH